MLNCIFSSLGVMFSSIYKWSLVLGKVFETGDKVSWIVKKTF